ncbi:class I adenylate-forming enzyme family protein [Alicyclobacillus sp. SO9]|uniref:class I adenylate-forming enzyme family protein n=1 Tax=Alicyclobacillus sp. SO9 TaxID=2665646 RepID=UPI0018E890B2|nr:class I adenylate-forming enzyme family protein [Alicyclobacillus sp. SO9]QQE78860.1 acyl--CoA ligase [Alicyclobacillus sp. SO9]
MLKAAEKRRHDIEQRFQNWPRRTVARHFQEQSKAYGERPLILTPTEEFSYEEVWNQAWSLAKSLMALGVKRRQHVAVLMANEPEFVFLYLAVSIVGAVCIPINTMLKRDELKYLLEQSDSEWLFIHQMAGSVNHGETVSQLMDAQPGTQTNQPGTQTKKTAIQQVVCIPNGGSGLDSRFTLWDEFVSMGEATPDSEVQSRFDSSGYPDEVANIIYTSGSTGLPKGVMLTHDMLLRCSYSTALSRAFQDGRRIYTGLPLYHVFALEEGLLAVSFAGGCVITASNFAPGQSLELITNYKANDFLCVPSMLVAMLNQPNVEDYDYSSLHSLMCAAAPAPVPVWERALRIFGVSEICTGYGGTEVTGSTVHTEVDDPVETVVTRVGRIKPAGSTGLSEFGGANVEYKVIHPETGEDLNKDSIGELTVRGNIVTRGYYNKPEETAANIDKDGWLKTGDLGRIDEQGYIEFLGRSKDVVKVSGENVSPKEIEEVITRHPAVAQAYVVGVPDRMTTEAGAAFIELKPGETCSRREMMKWCQNHLARFKVPRHYWFVESSQWPMTGSGKIQKFRLKELAQERLGADSQVTEKTPQ